MLTTQVGNGWVWATHIMNEYESDVNHYLVVLLFGELKTGEKKKLSQTKEPSWAGRKR